MLFRSQSGRVVVDAQLPGHAVRESGRSELPAAPVRGVARGRLRPAATTASRLATADKVGDAQKKRAQDDER